MQNNPLKREQSKTAPQNIETAKTDVNAAKPEAAVTEKKPAVTGVVADCLELNVRRAPSLKANVAAVIPALTEVTIDLDGSNGEFYKVTTPDGIQGFCMKKYIAVRR